MHSDAQTFCIELCKKGLEGLCTCVYGTYHTVIPETAPCCLRSPYYPSQNFFQNPKWWHNYYQKPRWWVKSLEEGEKENCCGCSISSTDVIPDWP